MSVFWTAPFSLAQGTLIQAKVLATNELGDGEYSNQNTAGATV